MNETMKQKLFALTALIMLTACGHSIHEGVVIEKRHEDARTYTHTVYMPINKMLIPQTRTEIDDEDWIVSVKAVKDGDTIVEDFYIGENDWNCLNVGGTFNDSIPCSTKDE